MLYTVLAPDAGDALIDGTSVVRAPLEARRRIGVLPHSAGLYPASYRAREHPLLRRAARPRARDRRSARADELIELLDMQDFADAPRPKGFSQGQRMKTALARALVHRPRNVLLDEPTNGLDVMAVRDLRDLLLKLRDEGHCVLFSSHVMQEVAALCDEVVVIAHGAVVAAGTPDAIRERTGHSDLEDAFVQLIGTRRGAAVVRAILTVFAQGVPREPARPAHAVLRAASSGRCSAPLLFAGPLALMIQRGDTQRRQAAAARCVARRARAEPASASSSSTASAVQPRHV